MKTASYRVVRMSVCYQDVEEEVMYGIELSAEEGKGIRPGLQDF